LITDPNFLCETDRSSGSQKDRKHYAIYSRPKIKQNKKEANLKSSNTRSMIVFQDILSVWIWEEKMDFIINSNGLLVVLISNDKEYNFNQ
jgi:hypothetical protein